MEQNLSVIFSAIEQWWGKGTYNKSIIFSLHVSITNLAEAAFNAFKTVQDFIFKTCNTFFYQLATFFKSRKHIFLLKKLLS